MSRLFLIISIFSLVLFLRGWEYLAILGIFTSATIFVEWKYHLHLYDTRRERLTIPLLFFVFGSLWDTLAVARGHWSFTGPGLTGVRIGVLPLEEYLFFLVLPYFGVTFYKLLKSKI